MISLKIAVLKVSDDDENKFIHERMGRLSFDDVDLLFLLGHPEIGMLQCTLNNNGWKYWTELRPGIESDKMTIASRSRLIIPEETGIEEQPDVGAKVYLPKYDITISGIDFPKSPNIQVRDLSFQRILKSFKVQNEKRTILIGDVKPDVRNFNTLLEYKHYFQEIASLGWVDAWRALHPITYEQIWYGNVGKQLHLNLVFLSSFLRESLLSAYHCHCSARNKQTGPDSGTLIVELA